MRTILDPMLIVPLRLSSRGRSGSSLWSRLSLDGHKITDRLCRHMCGCLELIRLASTTYIITYTSSMREVLASHLGFNVTLIIMLNYDIMRWRTHARCTNILFMHGGAGVQAAHRLYVELCPILVLFAPAPPPACTMPPGTWRAQGFTYPLQCWYKVLRPWLKEVDGDGS